MNHWLRAMAVFVLLIPVISCEEENTGTIMDKARQEESLDRFVESLAVAGITEFLEEDGPFTLFAPKNAAIDTYLSENGFSDLEEMPTDHLGLLLKNHVLNGKRSLSNLPDYLHTKALSNSVNDFLSMRIQTDTGQPLLNDEVAVSAPAMDASNGTIYLVDEVIQLPTLRTHLEYLETKDVQFSVLKDLIDSDMFDTDFTSLVSGFGPTTLVAPSNQAFVELAEEKNVATVEEIPTDTLERYLEYHLIEDQVIPQDVMNDAHFQTVEGDSIQITSDQNFVDSRGGSADVLHDGIIGLNGVIIPVDKVLLPQ